ncbi:TIGR01906 family membrane protein [Arthrobacter sp. I2-34]|uniref:TIGR01906 family membrane protein n=1 Tax=Arthrobacter hankyongi TaxID=2904801 RepID=A0ABS9L1Y6_9MICC|nr:TIGR01906 family membrane protein [Arthrobacter hankyongi]MCG2620583.1 TIGR01906 family membrane protein [Arthrobacter hankyongi]
MSDQEKPAGPARPRRMDDALMMPVRQPSRLPDLGAYGGPEPQASAVPEAGTPAAAGAAPATQPVPAAQPVPAVPARPDATGPRSANRRAAAREDAVNAKPRGGLLCQILLAVTFPFVLLIGAIRLVCTPLFLWVEYHRPGFPADSFGFSTEDRMTNGSYAMDYLLNWAGPRYLGDLRAPSGQPLFLAGEVSHMADVKTVITVTFLAGTVLLLAAVACMLYLRRNCPGGIRRGLFAGSAATLLLVIALGVLGALNWQGFFTEFHRIFFADGTWTFYTDDTLIRLFPGQFWMDAGLVIGLGVLLVSSLVLALTWPTRSRRDRSAERLAAARARLQSDG